MGLNLSDLGSVYIVCGKTDLRKGIDSLAYLIQSQFDLDPFSKSVFFFVVEKVIDLKPSTGMVKDSGCFISVLKMDN
ncbi:hypothetical protein CIRMBP1298_00933 [Enterococcus cecorum]|nr:hypothetical protein CIRMBP1264_00143 [Enterococcus cecorum]CAI3289667.1 hypothetical protein CIRMBP1254_00438 [Enterococcus cecorum]CAI3395141.1 hypothetical protein CIRMBP1298_00933 [Enterococcus cecorum]